LLTSKSCPSCRPFFAPKKQNPPSQRFWRGGIRELSRLLCSQLTASLHTGEGTIIRTLAATMLIRRRLRRFIVLSSSSEDGIEAVSPLQVESRDQKIESSYRRGVICEEAAVRCRARLEQYFRVCRGHASNIRRRGRPKFFRLGQQPADRN
jgi:hypothetical protein